MKGIKNRKVYNLLLSSGLPDGLKCLILEKYRTIEKHTENIEYQLKIKEQELTVLNQIIATLKRENNFNHQKLLFGKKSDATNNINKIYPETVSNKLIKNRVPEHWRKFKFLIIEDNHSDVVLITSIFKLWGLHLDIATSIEEARKKMTQKYDCIISDVILPDGDGLGHILEIRNNKNAVNQNTPVIIITANANKSGAIASQQANIQCYFNKPFSLKHLKRGLEKIFDTKENDNNTSTNVILDSKATWTWFDILSYKFNNRYHLMVEFMEIFLEQAKRVIRLLNRPIEKNNLDTFQYEIYNLKSTVKIIGFKNSYNLLSKMDKEFTKESDIDNLNQLALLSISQLEKDIRKVELQLN